MPCDVLNCRSQVVRASRLNRFDSDTLCSERISFHQLPLKEDIRKKWLDAIARPGLGSKKSVKVCSRHFEDRYIINKGYKAQRLMPDAIPTLRLGGDTDEVSIVEIKEEEDVPTSNVHDEVDMEFDVKEEVKHTSGSLPTLKIVQITQVINDPQNAVPASEHLSLQQRYDKLKRDLERVKRVTNTRLLKLKALQRKEGRWMKKLNFLNVRQSRIIDAFEKEKKEKEYLLQCLKNNKTREEVLPLSEGQEEDSGRGYVLDIRQRVPGFTEVPTRVLPTIGLFHDNDGYVRPINP